MYLKFVFSILKKQKSIVFLIVAVLIILANTVFLHSSFVGVGTSLFYLILGGYLLGKALIRGEEEGFVQLILGIFLVLCMFVLIGSPIVIIHKLDALGYGAILFSPVALLAASRIWGASRRRSFDVQVQSGDKASRKGVSYLSLVYLIYFILSGYCAFLLVNARSGWVHGTVWSVVSPIFFTTYALAALVLLGIILYSNTRAASKVLIISIFALISVSVYAIVLYPDNYGDPFDNMGLARIMYDYGSLKKIIRPQALTPFNIYYLLKEKSLALLTAMFCKLFLIDVYWVHTFITPILWSLFVPLSIYKVTRILNGEERVAVLAAFLTTFYAGFIGWASRSTGNSLGFMMFVVSLYFSLAYLKSQRKASRLLLTLLVVMACGLVHLLTGLTSLSFLLLALALLKYESFKAQNTSRARVTAYFLVLVGVLQTVFLVPAMFALNNFIYARFAPSLASEAMTAFSWEKLAQTDIWLLVFGKYVDYDFKDVVLNGIFPLVGFIGLAYALKRSAHEKNKKILILPMILAFLSLLIQYRMLEYAMVYVLFGPGRLWTFRDFIAVPFVALVIVSLVENLEGASKNPVRIMVVKRWMIKPSSRAIMAYTLIGLAISGYATFSVMRSYEWLRGLHLTALEVEAVKYIDENTDGRYVVFTMPDTTFVGAGFAGLWNPDKYYVFNKELGALPSVSDMVDYMRTYEASVGYFIAISFRTPNFERTIAEASRMYGVFKVLSNENGKIYIFYYNVPPLPPNHPNPDADVMAFFWDTPPGYYTQNGLMRVIINPVTQSLDVVDFYGDLYESILFNETYVGGEPLGDLVSVERYDFSSEEWGDWEPSDQLPSSEMFRFRLRFERDSLVGFLNKGEPFVRLVWESGRESVIRLHVGDFDRLYIPGLIGEKDSYNVTAREYGLLYTLSRTENVVLHPALNPDISGSYLTYNPVRSLCNLTITTGYLTYEFYVHNVDVVDQWAYIEVWLPDSVYGGTFPPFHYSIDEGKTWSQSLPYANFPDGAPIRTVGGAEVNWVVVKPSQFSQMPTVWRNHIDAAGGSPLLPESYTESGGGQNKLLFGLFLPAEDKALLKLGVSVYYMRPLEISYVFTDSESIHYGLRNMEEGLMKFYRYGWSAYVGGLVLTDIVNGLTITENEAGRIEEILVAVPKDSTFDFFAMREVATAIDDDGNGVPDDVEG